MTVALFRKLPIPTITYYVYTFNVHFTDSFFSQKNYQFYRLSLCVNLEPKYGQPLVTKVQEQGTGTNLLILSTMVQ